METERVYQVVVTLGSVAEFQSVRLQCESLETECSPSLYGEMLCERYRVYKYRLHG